VVAETLAPTTAYTLDIADQTAAVKAFVGGATVAAG
jgi:hypothetical protein